MDRTKTALTLVLLLAMGIGAGVLLTHEDEPAERVATTAAASAGRTSASPGISPQPMGEVPTAFRNRLGIAQANFVTPEWEGRRQPRRPQTSAREDALMEKFRTGSLSRLASGAVFVNPEGLRTAPRSLRGRSRGTRKEKK